MKDAQIIAPVVPEKPGQWGFALAFVADVLSYASIMVMLCVIMVFGALKFQEQQTKIDMLEENVRALQLVQSGEAHVPDLARRGGDHDPKE